jgi:hypothetical protein
MSGNVCEKCGSQSLYRDDDFVNGVYDIVCRICGKRRPVGAAPAISITMLARREENELLDIIKEGLKMGKTRACRNCGRERQISGDGCCATCYRVGRGLEGEKKAAALAATKARIDSGEVKRRGIPQASVEIAPAGAPAEAVATPKVVARARKKRESGAIAAGSAPGNIQEVEGGVQIAAGRVVEGTTVVCLDFATDRDQALYAALLEESTRLRRDLAQQVMWMIQVALDLGRPRSAVGTLVGSGSI